jgi:hypothetical protein
MMLSALHTGHSLPPGRFMVFISVRGWVDPRTIAWLEGLGKLKKSNDLIGNRTRNLPNFSIVPQPTTLPHILDILVLNVGRDTKYHDWYLSWLSSVSSGKCWDSTSIWVWPQLQSTKELKFVIYHSPHNWALFDVDTHTDAKQSTTGISFASVHCKAASVTGCFWRSLSLGGQILLWSHKKIWSWNPRHFFPSHLSDRYHDKRFENRVCPVETETYDWIAYNGDPMCFLWDTNWII